MKNDVNRFNFVVITQQKCRVNYVNTTPITIGRCLIHNINQSVYLGIEIKISTIERRDKNIEHRINTAI